MVETGAITKEQAATASAAIAFTPPPAVSGWFADWVADESQATVPPGADAVLHTSLDARLQATAETKLTALLDGPGAAAGVSQGAVVALDATTGAVRVMLGGRGLPGWRLQPCRRSPAAAWLGVQTVRLARRPRTRFHAQRYRAGRAAADRHVEPAEFRGHLSRRSHARGRPGAVAQHRLRPAAASIGRAARGGRGRAPGSA